MSSPLWKSLPALAAAVVMLATAPAAAQVCGDADGSGAVTVTDGVQTLRAAAGLSSSCTEATCDVDGNGTITVTDGVNVLRIAAGLSVTLACPGASVNTQVQNLLSTSLPIFGNLTKVGSSQGASASARAADTQTSSCDNAGGTFTVTSDSSQVSVTFDNCDSIEDGANYNGEIVATSDTLQFAITITDLTTRLSESLNGSFGLEVVGQAVAFSGQFQLAAPLGGFQVEFDQIVVDPNTGLFVGGALAFSIQSGQLTAISRVAVGFQPSNVAFVEVDLVDGESLPFNYDLVSGVLTPISN